MRELHNKKDLEKNDNLEREGSEEKILGWELVLKF